MLRESEGRSGKRKASIHECKHECNILNNEGILSIMVILCLRAVRTQPSRVED